MNKAGVTTAIAFDLFSEKNLPFVLSALIQYTEINR